ncbi:MAG: polysaccharide biosynthesis/export family protein [Pikeienuella sp.]
MLRSILLTFALFLAASISLLGQAAPAEEQDALPEIYLLAPGDVLDVSVLEDSSLNRQVLVRPDGKVSFPLAGTLDAAGKSPEELGVELRRALSKDFLEAPTITVSLVNLRDEQIEPDDIVVFYVLGEVASPGRFESLEPVDILQALAVAGGPGVFAAKSRIQIRRRDENGGETVALFDYELVEEGNGVQLQVIGDGDVVVVPERGLFE